MVDDIYVYITPFPKDSTTHEAILPGIDGYTIYLDAALTREQQQKKYLHAWSHVRRGDFERTDVQEIEAEAHGGDEI